MPSSFQSTQLRWAIDAHKKNLRDAPVGPVCAFLTVLVIYSVRLNLLAIY